MEEEVNNPKPDITEICASFSGKISTGSYENESPFFSFKEVYSTPLSDEFITDRQRFLHSKCYDQFAEVEQKSKAEKILKQRSDLRFYDRKGMKYPSVTSVVGWDSDFFMSPEDLAQYASRGTIIHRQVEIFLDTGEWKLAEEIPDVYADLVIVKKGSLGLKLDDTDFRGFFKKHPFEHLELETRVFNDEFKYAGRCDIVANFGDVLSVCDIKTGSTVQKEKAFKQMAAYAKALKLDIKQLVIINLTNKNKCGFANPIITEDIDKYWELFKRDREIFKQRFGI